MRPAGGQAAVSKPKAADHAAAAGQTGDLSAMIKTLRAAGAILTVCLFVAGCVSTGGGRGQPGEHGRLGMDRVSPVRSADLNTRLGVGYFERGDLKIAIEKLERAISLDPAHVPAYITLALVQKRLGRDAVARRHYRKAANLAPDDGATLNTYAVFLCQQGEYREADELFRRAVRDPRSEEHTSELQSRGHLVCRLLLEKKNLLNNL